LTKAACLRDLAGKSNSMPNARNEIIEKLAEVSPFWAGAFAACIDQGFDAQDTQELLEKCAQAAPILEEEYAVFVEHIKEAQEAQADPWYKGWWRRNNPGQLWDEAKTLVSSPENVAEGGWEAAKGAWEGAGNIGSTLSNAGHAVVGGVATPILGLGAGAEEAYNTAAGLVDGKERENWLWEMTKATGEQTSAAAQDLGSNVANVADPTARSNNLDEVSHRILTENNASQGMHTARDISKGIGDTALNAAVTAVAPGAIFNTFKGGTQAGVNTLRAFAPRFTSAATKLRGGNFTTTFNAANKAREASYQAHPILNYGMRNSFLPMKGPEMAGPGGTIAGMTGAPTAIGGVRDLANLAGKIPGVTPVASRVAQLAGKIPGVTPVGNVLRNAAKVRHLPAVSSLVGAELAEHTFSAASRAAMLAADPKTTQHPSAFSNETGFAGYAKMPANSRPNINNAQIQLPGAEVYTNAIKEGVNPVEAFEIAAKEFYRIGGVQPDRLAYNSSLRGSSLLNFTGNEQLANQIYPDDTLPTISPADPGLIEDFKIPFEGLARHRVEQTFLARPELRNLEPARLQQLKESYIASGAYPHALQAQYAKQLGEAAEGDFWVSPEQREAFSAHYTIYSPQLLHRQPAPAAPVQQGQQDPVLNQPNTQR
jgi:hypothetical protein